MFSQRTIIIFVFLSIIVGKTSSLAKNRIKELPTAFFVYPEFNKLKKEVKNKVTHYSVDMMIEDSADIGHYNAFYLGPISVGFLQSKSGKRYIFFSVSDKKRGFGQKLVTPTVKNILETHAGKENHNRDFVSDNKKILLRQEKEKFSRLMHLEGKLRYDWLEGGIYRFIVKKVYEDTSVIKYEFNLIDICQNKKYEIAEFSLPYKKNKIKYFKTLLQGYFNAPIKVKYRNVRYAINSSKWKAIENAHAEVSPRTLITFSASFEDSSDKLDYFVMQKPSSNSDQTLESSNQVVLNGINTEKEYNESSCKFGEEIKVSLYKEREISDVNPHLAEVKVALEEGVTVKANKKGTAKEIKKSIFPVIFKNNKNVAKKGYIYFSSGNISAINSEDSLNNKGRKYRFSIDNQILTKRDKPYNASLAVVKTNKFGLFKGIFKQKVFKFNSLDEAQNLSGEINVPAIGNKINYYKVYFLIEEKSGIEISDLTPLSINKV